MILYPAADIAGLGLKQLILRQRKTRNMAVFKILFLGDVVGKLGRTALASELQALKKDFAADLTIVNAENSAGGFGIEAAQAEELFKAGADVLTSGNHIWGRTSFTNYLEKNRHRVLRPINYASPAPGTGSCVWDAGDGFKVGVLNAIGRVFIDHLLDCPFRAIDGALTNELAECQAVFVDFHAEATSEKVALGLYLDGRVTAVVGTHTHVQTADERLLPKGTAYISDVGMCGALNGVTGMDAKIILERFVSGRPLRFGPAEEAPWQINGVLISVEKSSGKALSIERIRKIS